MGRQDSNTRRGLTIYNENPFIHMDMVKTRIKRMTNKQGNMMMVVSGETGEVVASQSGFWWAREVDTAQFVKLYINGVKAFSELTNAGTKVFEILYREMQKNIDKDRVLLSLMALEDDVKISKTTFTRGMRELMDKGFIAPTRVVGWYWLNPDYVFNGDRLTFVHEYRRTSEKKAKQQLPGQIEIDIDATHEVEK